MKILRIFDQFGWAYYFLSLEQKKYSRHQIDIVKAANFTIEMCKGYDVLYVSSPDMSEAINYMLPQIKVKFPNMVIIGGVAGEVKQKYPRAVDVVVSISARYHKTLREIYPDRPVIFLPEGIDTEYFKRDRPSDDFIVGWVGRPCTVKRPYLLDALHYPVKKQQAWGREHFVEGRTQEHMLSFYKTISCLVLVSSSECMPRVVLEAMSMGYPVVSTDVGSLRLVLDKEFLVPVDDRSCIIEMNKKLDALSSNRELFHSVGNRNKAKVEKDFSWRELQPLWDNIYEYSLDNKKEMLIIANTVIDKFKGVEANLENV